MSEEQKNIEKIDRYLGGNMSSEERNIFEAELEQDQELKSLFDFTKDTKNAIEHNELNALKSKLRQTEKGIKRPKQKSYIWFKVAASVALMAVLGYLVLQSEFDKNALYDKYYEPYPNIAEPISRSMQSAESAYQLYETSNYEEALSLLQSETDQTDTVLFYIAQCQMALDQLENANRNFDLISSNSPFYEPAQWYTVLIYLESKEKAVLRSKLNEIIAAEGSYASRAEALLDAL